MTLNGPSHLLTYYRCSHVLISWTSCLDVQLVPPSGELLLNITSCLILAHCPMIWKVTSSINRKYITCRNVVRRGPSHSHRHHAKKSSSAVWFSSYASGRTDRQTNIFITIVSNYSTRRSVSVLGKKDRDVRLPRCVLSRPLVKYFRKFPRL